MKLKKKIKSDRQKEQDKKGKERMSYYLRKKQEKLDAKKEAFQEVADRGITCMQKKVEKDGHGDWEEIVWSGSSQS